MSDIAEKALVHAPLGSANRFLERYFHTHAAPGGEGARLVLRAGDLSAPAVVTLAAAKRLGDMNPRYAVHWEAEKSGPYPVFDGELSIDGDEDYNAFWLVLAGSYQPPGGLVGEVFDAVVGHRVAEIVARGLLDAMRAEIEGEFAEEERAKQT